MKAGEVYFVNIKFRSIVMPDIWGNKTYETQLYIEGYPIYCTAPPSEWKTIIYNAD